MILDGYHFSINIEPLINFEPIAPPITLFNKADFEPRTVLNKRAIPAHHNEKPYNNGSQQQNTGGANMAHNDDTHNIKVGEIRATTMAVFEVEELLDKDRLYLRCLSSINPYYKVGKIYWDKPKYVLANYRLVPKKDENE